MAAIDASASPRKPRLATCSRSARLAILLVACRVSASASSSRGMPQPLSLTRMRLTPPCSRSIWMSVAPASRLFSRYFLQRRGGTLDHLAGGDLRNQHIGQDADAHNEPANGTPRRAAMARPRRSISAAPSTWRASGSTWVFSNSRWARFIATKRCASGRVQRGGGAGFDLLQLPAQAPPQQCLLVVFQGQGFDQIAGAGRAACSSSGNRLRSSSS